MLGHNYLGFLPQAPAERVVAGFLADPRGPPDLGGAAVVWEPLDRRVHRRGGPAEDAPLVLVLEEADDPE